MNEILNPVPELYEDFTTRAVSLDEGIAFDSLEVAFDSLLYAFGGPDSDNQYEAPEIYSIDNLTP